MIDSGENAETPSPVMTFQVADEWLAISIEQLERISQATAIWPVPRSRPDYLGLIDDEGELVPVLTLQPTAPSSPHPLVAVLQVRNERAGLAIQRAGRVEKSYRLQPTGEADSPPAILRSVAPQRARSPDRLFWLINADRLWAA